MSDEFYARYEDLCIWSTVLKRQIHRSRSLLKMGTQLDHCAIIRKLCSAFDLDM